MVPAGVDDGQWPHRLGRAAGGSNGADDAEAKPRCLCPSTGARPSEVLGQFDRGDLRLGQRGHHVWGDAQHRLALGVRGDGGGRQTQHVLALDPEVGGCEARCCLSGASRQAAQ